jgi:hypothetical protein
MLPKPGFRERKNRSFFGIKETKDLILSNNSNGLPHHKVWIATNGRTTIGTACCYSHNRSPVHACLPNLTDLLNLRNPLAVVRLRLAIALTRYGNDIC